eukprot:6768119-Ditylum_brightwellii.AAC.1
MDRFIPGETTTKLFEWQCTTTTTTNTNTGDQGASMASGYIGEGEHSRIPSWYRGHLIRAYLEGSADTKSPESEVLFGQHIEIARYYIKGEDIQRWGAGEHYLDHDNGPSKLLLNVISNQEQMQKDGTIRCGGSFYIQSIGFTFNELLGIYVLKKFPISKAKYQAKQLKAPAEKNYVKALAKTVREAPRNSASYFRGMTGW